MKSDVLHKNCSRKKSFCNNSLQVKTYQPTFLTSGRDDRAEAWIHKEFSERAAYGLYFRLKKISCGSKDQARARQSGEKCGPWHEGGQALHELEPGHDDVGGTVLVGAFPSLGP